MTSKDFICNFTSVCECVCERARLLTKILTVVIFTFLNDLGFFLLLLLLVFTTSSVLFVIFIISTARGQSLDYLEDPIP